MKQKAPPEVLSPSDLAYMSTLNERDRKRFLATKAADLKAQGFSYRKISKNMGTSHDTSMFVCENIERVWNEHTKEQYPDAHTLVILCDGGGSNSSSHRIVKQDLMDLADRMGMRLLVVHYPPYCSKFNPIEHRLFSQITRSWRGAPLMSLRDAAQRAAMTTTKKGLTVHAHINSKTYDIKRTVDDSYTCKTGHLRTETRKVELPRQTG